MNQQNWDYIVARGSITKANTDREWNLLGVTVSLVALPEETPEEETEVEETKEEVTEEEAVTVSRRAETSLLTRLTWGAWRPRESMIAPKDRMRRSEHPAELLFVTLGVESITRLASQNGVRHGNYVRRVQQQARAKGRGRGTGPNIDSPLFCAAIREAGLIQEDDAIVAVDCRLPHDPQNDRYARNHTGTLPETIAGFVDNGRFKTWLQETLMKVESGIEVVVAPRGGDGVPPGRLVVAFFCKRGHHRSVAGATTFAHVLQATSDSWHPMTTHLCEQLWDVSCGTDCPKCNGRSGVRGAALAAARDEFRELMST